MAARSRICSQHILFDGVVVLRAVDLGDRDLGVLIVALPALRRLLHFANLALGGRVHYTVYVRHRDCSFSPFLVTQADLSRSDTLGPSTWNERIQEPERRLARESGARGRVFLVDMEMEARRRAVRVFRVPSSFRACELTEI